MPARPELRRGAGRQGGGDGDEGKEMEGEEALSVRCDMAWKLQKSHAFGCGCKCR